MPKLKRFKKAASGQGSIIDKEIIRPDGSTYIRWEGYLSLGKDGNGKRKRTVVYGSSQDEVVKKLDTLKRQVATGTLQEDKRTVKEYLEGWLKHKKLEVKPRTHEFYSFYCEEYIYPSLGSIKLVKLTTKHVRDFLLEQADKVSSDLANKCRAVLFRGVKQAVSDGVLHRNVVEAVSPFKVETRHDVLWSGGEIMLLLNTARTHRLYSAFYLALSTGMRRGEVLGLRWQDIEGNILSVKQNLIVVNGEIMFSSPKTAKGVRRVVLDTETLSVLEEHRLKQLSEAKELKGEWQASKHKGLVFTSEVGTPISPFNFYRTWYDLQQETRDAYLELANGEEEKRLREGQIAEGKVFPHLRIHDMRHLHVSLLNKAGVDARTIADRIGHKNADFTLKRYAHTFEEQRQGAAIALTRLLTPPSGDVA
jgi:integrase